MSQKAISCPRRVNLSTKYSNCEQRVKLCLQRAYTSRSVHRCGATAHSQRVLAVDLNPRAANCARFNAQAESMRRAVDVQVTVGATLVVTDFPAHAFGEDLSAAAGQ